MNGNISRSKIPIVDISPLVINSKAKQKVVVKSIGDALKEWGFFYITGHAIDTQLQSKVEALGRQFFAQPLEVKKELLTGIAGLGYEELGSVYLSEGMSVREVLGFHVEYDSTDESERNVYPKISEFRETVLKYMSAMRELANHILRGMALDLNLDADYFYEHYMSDKMMPTIHLKFNNYPQLNSIADNDEVNALSWGIGEHTDFGLLTIIAQDMIGGLQVKSRSNEWVDTIPIENAFVCNIGDSMERLTRGLYRSTPHRVKGTTYARPRMSFPIFIGANLSGQMKAIDHINNDDIIEYNRWDGESVHQFEGTFCDYLKARIGKYYRNKGRVISNIF